MPTPSLRRLFAAGAAAILSMTMAPGADAAAVADTTVLFALPVGPDGVTFEGGGQEVERWGPQAIAVSPSGDIWIADSVARRLLEYSTTGERQAVIDLSAAVHTIDDLAVRADELVVLDSSGIQPLVLRIDARDSAILDSTVIPDELGISAGLSGVAYAPSGEVLLEYAGGNRTAALADRGHGRAAIGDGQQTGAGRFSVDPRPNPDVRSAAWFTLPSGQRAEVRTQYELSGIYFIAERADGTAILVDEVSQNATGQIKVDRTVRRYDRSGRVVAVGRLPLPDVTTYVGTQVAQLPSGDLIALVTTATGANVVRIETRGSLKSILPDGRLTSAIAGDEPGVSVASCRDRRVMDNVLFTYLTNSTSLTTANITGSCTNRTKPRYLGGAGTYPSVSYDWAGWDLPATFNAKMDETGYRAGDISDVPGAASCSRGTDCSGLVSRVWGLANQHYTSNLANVSHSVARSNMISYDVYNKANSHVVIWHTRDAQSGENVSESTVTNSYDRVIGPKWWAASRFDGYAALQYDNACN
jgi:hypothetical protein